MGKMVPIEEDKSKGKREEVRVIPYESEFRINYISVRRREDKTNFLFWLKL
jgi:hypothetical protein